MSVVPEGETGAAWFNIEGETERNLEGEVTFQLALEVDKESAAPGAYPFTIQVVSEADSERCFAVSEVITFEVPRPGDSVPSPAHPWWVWAAVGGGVVVLGLLIWLVVRLLTSQAPALSAANLTIEADCSGAGGFCVIGDRVVFRWDNSASGDHNPDVTALSQVIFDLSKFGLDAPVNPDSVDEAVFTYGWSATAGAIDAVGVDFAASVTGSNERARASATSLGRINVDNEAPAVSAQHVTISGDQDGGLDVGSTLTISWDNSASGDGNRDLAGNEPVKVDLVGIAGGQDLVASDNGGACDDSADDGIWTACYTLQTGDAVGDLSAAASVTVVDDVGNVTSTTEVSTVDLAFKRWRQAAFVGPGGGGDGGPQLSTDPEGNAIAVWVHHGDDRRIWTNRLEASSGLG